MQRHLHILIIHIIKIHAERKTCSSWEASIRESLKRISQLNTSFYNLREELEEVYEDAFVYASKEVFGGVQEDVLSSLISKEVILIHCKHLLEKD